MAYFAIGMAMHSEGSYEDVLSQLTDGLAWSSGWAENHSPPSKSAIFQARVRLGAKPMKALFERVAAPIGTEATPRTWLAGRRLVAVDGLCLDVADTTENAPFFGRPGVNKGEQSAFPQARVVAFAECGTHAMFAAEVGKYTVVRRARGARRGRRGTAGLVRAVSRDVDDDRRPHLALAVNRYR